MIIVLPIRFDAYESNYYWNTFGLLKPSRGVCRHFREFCCLSISRQFPLKIMNRWKCFVQMKQPFFERGAQGRSDIIAAYSALSGWCWPCIACCSIVSWELRFRNSFHFDSSFNVPINPFAIFPWDRLIPCSFSGYTDYRRLGIIYFVEINYWRIVCSHYLYIVAMHS